jgi:hypothetical protein
MLKSIRIKPDSAVANEDTDDDLLPEYNFDYQQAKSNRFVIENQREGLQMNQVAPIKKKSARSAKSVDQS